MTSQKRSQPYRMATGVIKMTVVTLSRKLETKHVIKQRKYIIGQILPPDISKANTAI